MSGNDRYGAMCSELIDHLNGNLNDFAESLSNYGERELIEMKDKILFVYDTHHYLTEQHQFTQEELRFCLQFQNPLEMVVDVCWKYGGGYDDFNNALDEFYDEQWVLESHPLINIPGNPDDLHLRRYLGVDLAGFLYEVEKIVADNPWDGRKFNSECLLRSLQSDNPNDKWTAWRVSGNGTELFKERDIFMNKSPEYGLWINYPRRNQGAFGYFIEVTGINGSSVVGNVYEIGDLKKHTQYMRKTALAPSMIPSRVERKWRTEGGEILTIKENDENRKIPPTLNAQDCGTTVIFRNTIYEPEMTKLLYGERTKRLALPIGRVESHLAKLTAIVSEFRELSNKTKLSATESPKPKTLAEKMQAANKKVKTQDEQNTNKKPQKREERE